MFLVDKDSAAELPVIFRDDDIYSSAKTGIAHGSVTLKFRKWGATTWTTDVIDVANWTEVGDGHYTWNATANDLDTKGLFLYIVQAADCVQYEGAVYVSGNDLDDIVAAINALNDLDAAAVLAALTTDSTKWAGANIANLDRSIITLESNIRGADSDTLKTVSDEIAALNDLAQSDILSDATPFAGANITHLDRAISVAESNIRGADSDTLKTLSEQIDGIPGAGDMWDALTASHVAADSFGKLVNDYLDAAVSTRATHTAADVQALILSDATPFDGANISNLDRAISVAESNIRGADSDTLKTISDEIAGLNDLNAAGVLAALTTDSTKWAGANIANLDRAISVVESNIRGTDSDTLKTISDEIAGLHNLSGTEILAALTTDSTKWAGTNIANLDRAISTAESNIRGADSDTLKTLSDQIDGVGGGGGATAEEIADAVLDELLSEHTADGSLSDVIQAIYDKLSEGEGDCSFE